jgi:hypothetical protein
MKWNSDGKIVCRNCNKKPASIKRFSTCLHCYNQIRNAGRLSSKAEFIKSDRTLNKYEHRCEVVFAQTHPSFFYEPVIFHVNGERYTPDFYDPTENIFYEIIGTRQRFSQLRHKLEVFRTLYPNICLEVCSPDGKLYHAEEICSES